MNQEEVAQLAKTLVEEKEKVKTIEEELKGAKKRVLFLEEESLPSAMQELGFKKLVLETGQTITVALKVYASIPNDFKAKAFGWLDNHGFGELIKTEVKVNFGRGENESADKLVTQLEARGMDHTMKESIHPQTLTAFLREQLRGQRPVPMDLFGARSVFSANVK